MVKVAVGHQVNVDATVERLVTTSGYDAQVADLCAVASAWSYGKVDVAVDKLKRAGFASRPHKVSVVNEAMLVVSHAQVFESSCGRVMILAYRGTEPSNAVNWLTNADVDQVPLALPGPSPTIPSDVLVHGGFWRNTQVSWDDVQSLLASNKSLEALYITGHSLGGAMAAIAGMWLATSKAPLGRKLRGVYTFGQPMIGSPHCAEYCEQTLGTRMFRHVYAQDVVPHLPPRLGIGKFQHFGSEWRATTGAPWTASERVSKQALDTLFESIVVPTFASLVEMIGGRMPGAYSWYEHSPVFYLAASEKRSPALSRGI